ncbi:MAG: hypothetical protein JXB42_00180 [Deltaproteobacteria bacterium]|nr:hypothetical protein [Deltaproteobacteria bacterium]
MVLIFDDGFEDYGTTQVNWSVFNPSLSWYDLVQDATISYEGAYSLHVLEGGHFWRDFDPVLHDCYVEYAFYDNMSGSITPAEANVAVNNHGSSGVFRFGIATQASVSNYVYLLGGSWHLTNVKRSQGWHVVKIWIRDTGMSVAIDDATVIFGEPSITYLNNLSFMRSPGSVDIWWDDVNIYSPAPEDPNPPSEPPPETPTPPIDANTMVTLGLGGAFALYLLWKAGMF